MLEQLGIHPKRVPPRAAVSLSILVFVFSLLSDPTSAFRISNQGAPGGAPVPLVTKGTSSLGGPPAVDTPRLTAKLQSARQAALKAAGAVQGLAGTGGAVVEGEFVNGKSVKDWTVSRSLYQALHMAMAEELARDPTVCIMGEDVGHYGGSYKTTKDFHFRFGNLRCLDTPICENTFLGMGVGAAMHGLRPVVEGMNLGFLLLAFNQISNNAGMVRATSGGQFDVPMVIRGPGGVGKQLGPEHSQRIEAYLMAVPGLKLVACSTPRNARGLLKSAIRENNPVVFFEHVLTYGITEEIPLLPYTLPIDKAEIALEGSDITILCYSKLRHVAMDAAKELKKLNIHPEIVDLISLKPLDMETIKKSVQKTKRCIILDESSRTGGIGGEIYAQVVENCYESLIQPPVRLATKDIPTPYAKELEDATIIDKTDVFNAVLWALSPGKK